MATYKYTHPWFLQSEIRSLLLNFVDVTKVNTILEIGCYEGLSSVYFADHLLNQVGSSLTCVDPFLTIDNNDHCSLLQNQEELNFDHNIKLCKNSEKIAVHKVTSDVFFFKQNSKRFDLIYIDGCHEPDYILRDMENSFNCLEKTGIMWMDDYLGGDGIKIKATMDAFLATHVGEYELIHQGYQLAIRKMA